MLASSLRASEWFFVFFHVSGVNRKVQKMFMERDHTGFGRVDLGHERRTLMGMNEDSFVGKIQKKKRVFFYFREKKF